MSISSRQTEVDEDGYVFDPETGEVVAGPNRLYPPHDRETAVTDVLTLAGDDVPDCVVSTGPVETVRFVTGIKS